MVARHGVVEADIGILDGRIAAIETSLAAASHSASKRIEASGRWVMPGGVDVHCHIEQMSGMGQMNADTFETATTSAAMGGTTSVISFAAQAKGERLRDTVDQYAQRAQRGAMVDHAFHIIVSDLSVPEIEADLQQLIDAGHRSLKIFTTYNIKLGDDDILYLMTLARRLGALVCVHAENDAIISSAKSALIDSGKTAPRHHALSRPPMAEIEAIQRMCRFAEYLHQPVMIFHVSTQEGVEVIRDARKRGVPVWAETCPHYLFMTQDILDKPGLEGAKWMCSPPQRQKEDQEALWSGLIGGDLQIISSDHAPYRFDESGKLATGAEAGFHEIANGLPGLETRLPLLFDDMVSKGRCGPEEFVRLTSTAPAKLYGLPGKGEIAVDMDADITIWDPLRKTIYGANDLNDNVGYNPWQGREITGWPVSVLLRGNLLVDEGQFLGMPGQGRWVSRPELATQPARSVQDTQQTAEGHGDA